MYFKQTVESTCCYVLYVFSTLQVLSHFPNDKEAWQFKTPAMYRLSYGIINKYTLSNLNPFLVALSITAGSRAIVHSNLISKLILLLIFAHYHTSTNEISSVNCECLFSIKVYFKYM